jgi:hypothetical protein
MGGPNASFPRWAGPVIGVIVGIALVVRPALRQRPFNATYLAVGAVCGMLAGSLVWLLDAPSPAERRPPSVLGIVLAALAVFPGCLPFAGLMVGVPAFLVNRRMAGWPNTASRLGLGLAIVLTVIVALASVIPL